MSSFLAEKFADVLTSNDILELFKRLEESLGSLRKAAMRCRLQRKTVYDWGKARSLKLPTKKKVLGALLEENTEETLAYMTRRSRETASELLSIYLTTLYERAVDPESGREQFRSLLERFEKARKENAGMILDTLETEVSNMLSILEERALELNIRYDFEPTEVVKATRLATIMPTVIAEIHGEYPFQTGVKLSQQFNLPTEFVDAVTRSVEQLVNFYQKPKEEIVPSSPRQYTAGAPASEALVKEYRLGEIPQITPAIATWKTS